MIKIDNETIKYLMDRFGHELNLALKDFVDHKNIDININCPELEDISHAINDLADAIRETK